MYPYVMIALPYHSCLIAIFYACDTLGKRMKEGRSQTPVTCKREENEREMVSWSADKVVQAIAYARE